jgi:hypothetical protein
MIPDLISAIIPVHNRPVHLSDAVASVLAQDYRPIEILIVDDGSSDGETPALALSLADQYPDLVRYLRRANGGPGLARETGRLACCGEFLQYLDSDDVLLPGKFTAQVRALRARPEASVAYGITLYRDASGALHPQPLKATGELIDTMFPRFLNERWWETATPLYRRSCCDQAGPWSDLCLEEDWEYDCRIAALGGQLVWCPIPVSEHRDHSGFRLSRNPPAADPQRLSQRARAQTLIHDHARRYGLPANHPAMQRFGRSLFMLARQCGSVGLKTQAAQLCKLALSIMRDSGKKGLDLRLYRAVAKMIGWRRAGWLAGTH